MVAPRGTGTLPNLPTPINVQPSEPRLQDTVSPPAVPQQELVSENSRATSGITSTEPRTSEIAPDAEAQPLITPRNVIQPLRNTHVMETGNASESPAEVIDTFQPLSKRVSPSVEVSGITTSKGDVFAAHVGTILSTNSPPLFPEGHQANANSSGDRINLERRVSFLKADPLVSDMADTDTGTMGSINSLPSSPEGYSTYISFSDSRIDLERADPLVLDLAAADTGIMGSISSLLLSLEGSQIKANVSTGRIHLERRLSFLKTDLLVSDRALTLYRPTTTPTDDQGNVSVGNAETTPGSTPSPGQGIIDGVGVNLSGDGNDPERRLSEVVIDIAAADSHDTSQTLR